MIGAKSIEHKSILDFSKESLFNYGSYVVEERAVPDFRDGLKPVHRAILWSLHGLGLRSNVQHKKAARTIGDVIGKYHPHGDSAAYGAMITLANIVPPAIDGQGNWGGPIDGAGAMRYTEARMSKFTDMFLLDPLYLKVVPKVPNYSDDDQIPLYLPALLPSLLLNGSAPVPAYGVSVGNPAFTVASLSRTLCMIFRGEEVTAKLLARNLKPYHEFGCEVLSDRRILRPIMEEGRGSLRHQAIVNGDRKARRIVISTFSPGTLSNVNSVEKTLTKLAALPGVKRTYSQQGKKSKGSGPYGACFVCETATLKDGEWDKLVEKVRAVVTSSVAIRLGVTVRHAEKPNSFHYLNFVKFFRSWVRYRIGLEQDLLNYQIGEAEKRIKLLNVYLWAITNLKDLLKVLPKVLASDEPAKTMSKLLKISVEDSEIILQRKLSQLAKMEGKSLEKEVAELEGKIRVWRKAQKDPGQYVANKTEELVKRYLKSPDRTNSGVPVL